MTDQTNHLVNATPLAKSSMAKQTCYKDRGPSILTKSITEALSSKRPVKEVKEPNYDDYYNFKNYFMCAHCMWDDK